MPSPNNLPLQLTSFIGREREIAEVKRLLCTSRLLTLTGPGGSGKTRLALQSASQLLDEYPDEVFSVNLAPITDPNLVVSTVAQTLHVKEVAGQPLVDTLKAYLQKKQMLLVLDNFEQVVGAATQVSDLLISCPRLKVLVTSREVLRVQGEQEYAVSPLSFPDPHSSLDSHSVSQYEAVALFVQRAQSASSTFALTEQNAHTVAEICMRLDGLPLTIELAAARIRMLPPSALLTRLSNRLAVLTGGARDLAARQQTLRGTIDWSYDLLDEGRKQLFRRMAVFLGGRTVEALEAVCNYDGKLRIGVLDGLGSLLNSSLIRQRAGANGEGRFLMLETIHEYASEKLEESGEAGPLRRQHALYFMALAEEAEPHLITTTQREWLDRLEDEHDNLRVALKWARETATVESVEVGLRIGGAIWRLWHTRGYPGEGREHLGRLLLAVRGLGWAEVNQVPSPTSGISGKVKAKALNGAGRLALMQGDFATARVLHEESLSAARELGDKSSIAYSLSNLGSVSLSEGNSEAARALYEESVALSREIGDVRGIAICLNGLGHIAVSESDYKTGRSMYEECLPLMRKLGDKISLALSLNALGLVVFIQGDYQLARSLYEESLSISRELGDKGIVSWALFSLGSLACTAGDYEAARSLYDESLTIRRGLGDQSSIAWSLDGMGHVALAEEDFLAARTFYEESLAIRREIGEKWGIAHSLLSLGNLALAKKDYDAARSLFEESVEAHQGLGNKSGMARSLGNLGNLAYTQGEYEAARSLYNDSLVIRREIEETWGIAAALAGIGGVLVELGQPEAGARLLGCVEALLESMGARLEPGDQMPYERGLLSAHSNLGDSLAAALQAGRAMALENAIEYALEQIEVSAGKVIRQSYPCELTRREVELLGLLVEGLTNEQIAERLFLSTNTVRSHLHSIYSKINVGNRGAAARFAVENNLT